MCQQGLGNGSFLWLSSFEALSYPLLQSPPLAIVIIKWASYQYEPS